MTAEYFYKSTKKPGVETGPVSLTAIRALYRAGKLVNGDLFRERAGSWLDLSSLDDASFEDPQTDQKAGATRTDSSLEMKRLFVECLDRQKTHHPPPKPVRVQSSGPSVTDMFGSAVSSAFSYIWRAVFTFFAATFSFFVFVFSNVQFAFKSKIAWAVAAVILVAASIPLMSPIVSETFLSQQEIYARLSDTYARLKEIRSKDTKPDNWDEIREQAQSTVKAMLPKVRRMARTSDPVALSLLWITRDYLPELLAAQDGPAAQIEEKIQTHLARVERTFSQPKPHAESWDTMMIVMVALDVIGACAAVAYFSKDLLQRRFAMR
jgi:hypothetical protein